LQKMLLPFKLGVGGRVGNGKQYVSWIAIDDAVGAIHHVICTEAVGGPVNMVSPNPVTNAEFTRILARVLSRSAILPLPAFGVRLAFGELADALLLASQRVRPERLIAIDFQFEYPVLGSALAAIVG